MTNVPTEIHKLEERSQRMERLERLQETQRRAVTFTLVLLADIWYVLWALGDHNVLAAGSRSGAADAGSEGQARPAAATEEEGADQQEAAERADQHAQTAPAETDSCSYQFNLQTTEGVYQ